MGFTAWLETKPPCSTLLLSSFPFFLSFPSPPPSLLFLSEDGRFLFHLCPGFEACLINVGLILKPLFWGGEEGGRVNLPRPEP